MKDGSYTKFNLWLGEGWDKVKAESWQAPLYWHHIDGEWMNYTLSGLRPVDSAEPVTHISFYEADAFASWAGARLLTEPEWEVAAKHFNPKSANGNFAEKGNLHPIPVNKDSEYCSQLLGDTWEWIFRSKDE